MSDDLLLYDLQNAANADGKSPSGRPQLAERSIAEIKRLRSMCKEMATALGRCLDEITVRKNTSFETAEFIYSEPEQPVDQQQAEGK